MGNFDKQIENAFNQPMYEYRYRYLQDITGTIYTNWCTASQFENCYPNTIVIDKRN
jgi:hypothetical protein